MWEPLRLTNLLAFTTCYRGSFTFFNHYVQNPKNGNQILSPRRCTSWSVKLNTYLHLDQDLECVNLCLHNLYMFNGSVLKHADEYILRERTKKRDKSRLLYL
jgi:hypothetical protein